MAMGVDPFMFWLVLVGDGLHAGAYWKRRAGFPSAGKMLLFSRRV
jgi:hypothetical protein